MTGIAAKSGDARALCHPQVERERRIGEPAGSGRAVARYGEGVSEGQSIKLDGLEVLVEADGEEILVPWISELALKYRVRVTAEDGYVHESSFWVTPWDDEDGNTITTRDYEGVAWVSLTELFYASENPRFAEESKEEASYFNEWPSVQRKHHAYVDALAAAAKRLAPLLERNRAAIYEGTEKVEWW